MGQNDSTFWAISTHALREEGDERRTKPVTRYVISTHALREEGDVGGSTLSYHMYAFYPRPPRGGRPAILLSWMYVQLHISTHALREEVDLDTITILQFPV